MIDRRTFLKISGATTMLWAGRGIPAVADDGSRVALVIGNNAYVQAPLDNPVNDAKAVGGLLRNANFSVDLRTDTTRDAFLEGIEGFATAVTRRQTRLGLFYFAGHGAQLAWKNYLMPVDAHVATGDDLARRCVDLNLLLQRLAETEGKTFVVILDACRNDPFAGAFRAEQKGLSQFDAPVGSLLAYATAPGSVASDGAGQNGLYTGHLLKELAAPQTSIEDALKRVRLNVRLDSKGEQIPWESTSLEESVVLFPTRGQLDDAEIERLFEAELAAWNAVRQSRTIDDWVSYLRQYPTGRFAEIAQVRLNRLLVAREKQALAIAAATPAPVSAKPAVVPATPPVAAVVPPPPTLAAAPAAAIVPVGAGIAAIAAAKLASAEAAAPLMAAAVSPAPAANPYSAGTHRLGRDYKVGDRIHYRHTDLLTGTVEGEIELQVTAVDPDADRVEFNRGMWISDLNGNIEKMGPTVFDMPVAIFPAELQVGKKWIARFTLARQKRSASFDLNLRIRTRERVVVPAGEFAAFKIEGLGWGDRGQRMDATYWVVPGLNPFYVRRELVVKDQRGMFRRSERHELVAYSQ